MTEVIVDPCTTQDALGIPLSFPAEGSTAKTWRNLRQTGWAGSWSHQMRGLSRRSRPGTIPTPLRRSTQPSGSFTNRAPTSEAPSQDGIESDHDWVSKCSGKADGPRTPCTKRTYSCTTGTLRADRSAGASRKHPPTGPPRRYASLTVVRLRYSASIWPQDWRSHRKGKQTAGRPTDPRRTSGSQEDRYARSAATPPTPRHSR